MNIIKAQLNTFSLRNNQGFTLLEVLIAMAIFGSAIVFLLKSINEQEFAHSNIKERTIAHWVAVNKMNETRTEKNWPSIGTTRGDQTMHNHKWYWLQTVSKTSEKELRQIEIEVRHDESDKLPTTRFVGFIANKKINAGT